MASLLWLLLKKWENDSVSIQSISAVVNMNTTQKLTSDSGLSRTELENARVEYCATQDAFFHLNNLSWKVGSILIAGVVVFWGLLLDMSADFLVIACANLFVCVLMSIWLFYAGHNRQIYLYKLHRVRQLEKILGMWQHRRFTGYAESDIVYPVPKPSGHWLYYCLYLLVSIGGPILLLLSKINGNLFDLSKEKNVLWLSLAVCICISFFVLGFVVKGDRSVKDTITLMESDRPLGDK